jgi:hypothetical protein
MSTIEHEIETVLRAAPAPAPPSGLKEQLIAQVRLTAVRPTPDLQASTPAPTGWLRRWWPMLAPAAVSLACAVGLTTQQMEIRDLQRAIQDSSRDAAPNTGALSAPNVGRNDVPTESDATARTEQEIARLKALAGQLAAEVAELEQMRADNAKLRAQLAKPPAGFLSADETEALAKAKEKAESIACINHLKQMGLSVRCWALDNNDFSPPDMLSMSNELSTPMILVCPGDKAHEAAKNWASYTSANCSYEYLVTSESKPETEPTRVLFRCPIHGHVCLCDGSVQGGVAKLHPEQLVHRDGKLYLEDSPPPVQPGPTPQPANPLPDGSNP